MPGRVSGDVLVSYDPELEGEPSWRRDEYGVWVRCGAGHIARLNPEHNVASDGTVKPSIECREEDCGWHVHATLDRWGEFGDD